MMMHLVKVILFFNFHKYKHIAMVLNVPVEYWISSIENCIIIF
jgi:hypothetical protein